MQAVFWTERWRGTRVAKANMTPLKYLRIKIAGQMCSSACNQPHGSSDGMAISFSLFFYPSLVFCGSYSMQTKQLVDNPMIIMLDQNNRKIMLPSLGELEYGNPKFCSKSEREKTLKTLNSTPYVQMLWEVELSGALLISFHNV